MATSASNYKILLEAQLNTGAIEATIKAISNKATLFINVGIHPGAVKKVQEELDKLTRSGGAISKVKVFETDSGEVDKMAVTYTNQLGQVEQKTIEINKELAFTKTRMVDIDAASRKWLATEEALAKQNAKNADEMTTMANAAERYLAKAATYPATPSVMTAKKLAADIVDTSRLPITAESLAKVRQMKEDLKLVNVNLDKSESSWKKWGDGIKNALTQTLQYSISLGLVYGALAKLKEGLQYVVDLNKEMVKIQVLNIEGAKSPEEITALANSYNQLAKELGVTTKEVAAGSVEWLKI